jgi:hypothetical protein
VAVARDRGRGTSGDAPSVVRRVAAQLVALVLGVALVAGCGATTVETAARPGTPDAPDLATPDAAVRSYLDWTTFSYRMVNSELATLTCTPEWGVHIDSYIQLNRQEKQRGIDQLLTKFEKRSESAEGTRTILVAYEEWDYRYFSLADERYISPAYKASYDTTYTLVSDGTRWLVDDVAATPLTPLK